MLVERKGIHSESKNNLFINAIYVRVDRNTLKHVGAIIHNTETNDMTERTLFMQRELEFLR